MSLIPVTCGFVPLTDSAVLVAAHEMGFAAEEGIALDLRREGSWSSIRDKISLGIYPAAHMLAPMAPALCLGRGPVSAPVIAPLVLNLNGNTLTATPALAAELRDRGAAFGDARATALALTGLGRRLRIGVPYPQSMHRELLRHLFRLGGADPDRACDLLVAPPPLLPEVLGAGEVDAVLVGEPWGSLAVERGLAEMLLTGAAIRPATPEKVLALDASWAEAEPGARDRLLRALVRAGEWAGDPASTPVLAELLARPAYLDCPASAIEPALRGDLMLDARGRVGRDPDTLRLGGARIARPDPADFAWMADSIGSSWGVPLTALQQTAAQCFAPDTLASALNGT